MQENKYHPSVCGYADTSYGTVICRLNTEICALHWERKCYEQSSDEAVEAIGKIINKEEGEKET